MKNCNVGMFRLPGLTFGNTQLSPELVQEMEEWCNETNCGTKMTDTLWSFKSEKKRDWFILKWSDSMPRDTADGSTYLVP